MGFAEIVASWPPANYVDPPSRGEGIIVIASAVFGSLATIATAMRVYTRFAITRTLGSDDILIVLAWLWGIAMMVCLSIASRLYGFNLHIWDIPFDKIPTSNVYTLLFEVTFSISSSCTKLSLLWFCRRIRGDGRKINCTFHDVAIVVTMMVIAVFESAFLIMLFLQCRPLKALFDLEPTYPYACNINSHLLSFAASVANTITDFFTTLIPITIVAKLHLPTRQRIAIMTIFALGATVNIAGALRTYYDHQSMIVTNLDRSWVGWPTCVCGVVEIGLGVIVTSVPALRPFLRRFMPCLLESRKKYRYAGNRTTPKSSSYKFSSSNHHQYYQQQQQQQLKQPRSRTMFDFSSFFDKSVSQDNLVTTAAVGGVTAQIEMQPRRLSFEEHQENIDGGGIRVTKTVEQETRANIGADDEEAVVGGYHNFQFGFNNRYHGQGQSAR